ncbi:MAG: hypothetical protein M3258_04080 [Thermoproteota archaeon]|nr:hypothetical protein [Thermoproteota archaeon]
MLIDTIALLLAAILIISTVASATATRVLVPSPSTIFQSDVDGFRVGVPSGWIVEDIDNTDPVARHAERTLGGGLLARLCPKDIATSQVDGTRSCPQGMDSVLIFRYANLKSRPEFADIIQQNRNITTSDLVAFYLKFLELQLNFSDFTLLEDADVEVNVTDPHTNQSTTTAPAKYIEITYLDGLGHRLDKDFALLVISNDDNTGYALIPSFSLPLRPENLPPQYQEIFDSFQLLVPNMDSSQSNTVPVPRLSPHLIERTQPLHSTLHNS